MTPEGQAATSLPAGSPEAYIEALAVLYYDLAAALEGDRERCSAPGFMVPGIRDGARGVALSQVCVESDRQRAWVAFPDI